MLGNAGLILVNRPAPASPVSMLRASNPALSWLLGATMIGLALVIYVPDLSGIFKFAPLNVAELLSSLGAACTALLVYEIYKGMVRSRDVRATL